MSERFLSQWYGIRDSLWFFPALVTANAAGLALLAVWVDTTLLDRRSQLGWLFGGGAEGARGVLSAIASTMITVTALVFSITVVALQLASSQLTPRVLRTFMSDRTNQLVLGFFIGTFTYALLVLRTVRSPLEDQGSFVPSLSVTLAIVLALVSVGLLIFFVHHAANSMRASIVIDRATGTALGLVERLYPGEVGRGVRAVPPVWLDIEPAATVAADACGYVQTIDDTALFGLAERHALTVRMEPCVGDFLLPGATIASVWPEDALDDEVTGAVRGALVLARERTTQDDIELGLQLLVDIAVKALSPGINDPTTATICIDRLSEVVTKLANRTPPDEVRTGDDGKIRLVLPSPGFAHLVETAFAQIRHYGADDPAVAAHLLNALGRMVDAVPPERQAPIREQAEDCLRAARAQLQLAGDQRRLDAAAAWMRAAPAEVPRGGVDTA